MAKSSQKSLQTLENGISDFEKIKHVDENGEFWYARELMKVLGYNNWQNFSMVIEKSQKSAEKATFTSVDHFTGISKMVALGKSKKTVREVPDFRLDRYACYLIAQNGDPVRKPKIAEAQTYFAIQTRRQELNDALERDRQRLERRKEFSESDKKLSADILESGVSVRGMTKIKAQGNKVFFGGNSNKDMQEKLGTGKRPWANRASNVVLAGKTLANELTSDSIRYRGVSGAPEIENINNSNNQAVRNTIHQQQGLYPEDYPPAEDTEKIQRRLNKADSASTLLT